MKPRILRLGVRSSAIGVRPFEMNITSACVAQRASSRPHTPPSTASSVLSTSNCRMTPARPAPSASRIAISGRRAAARASNRLAVFAHAISSTTPTIASRMNNGCENCRRSDDTADVELRTTLAGGPDGPLPGENRDCSGPCIAASSTAAACSRVTPDLFARSPESRFG